MTTSETRIPFRGRDALLAAAIALLVAAVIVVPLLAAPVAFAREEAIAAVGLLGREPTSKDALPAGFPAELHGDGGLDRASTRYLGDFDGDRYWVARDARGQVCVVAQTVATPEQTVASCAPPSRLEAEGVAVEVSGRWQLAAFLLPDSVDTSQVRGDFARLGSNLVVARPGAPADARLEVPRDSGGGEVVLVSGADAHAW
jgi:hypothetical protein